MDITLVQANIIISAALKDADARGFKPLTVVVLDRGGHVVAAARQDGAANKRFEIAHGKAHKLGARLAETRNILTRALGIKRAYEIDVQTVPVEVVNQDRRLLTGDHLRLDREHLLERRRPLARLDDQLGGVGG